MNRKRMLPIVLSVVIISLLIVGIFAVRGFIHNRNDKYVKITVENSVTRYEWMEMLCKQAGMTEYKNMTPYYSDVDEKNTYFTYIQSAVEWEVLSQYSKFEGDGGASGRFIALTVMKTIGQNKLQIYLGTDDEITDDIYIKLAIENELIKEEELHQSFSKEACENILKTYESLYYGEFWQKDISEVKYQDGVKELSIDSILKHNETYSEIVIKENVISNLSEGDIVIIEQDNTGLKMAKQIAGISADGLLTLEDTELEKTVNSLVVSDITSVSFDDIANYYRLEESKATANWTTSNNNFLNCSTDATTEFQSKGFKILLTTKEENGKSLLEVSVTDNDTGITYLLPIKKVIENDSTYYAEVNVDKIYVASQVKYQALTGVEYVDVALDAHSTFGGGVHKELDEKADSNKFLLCKTPVPLGNGLVGVDIEIYLVISAEGNITLEAEMPMKVSVRYEKDKGIRNFTQDISVENPLIEANCEASAMLRAEPTLIILSCLNVIDAEADIGAVVSAEAILRSTSQLCIDAFASYPVFTVSICGDEEKDTLIRKLGLYTEWKIIPPEKALYQIELHYEILPDGTSQFVDRCTYNELPVTDESESTKSTYRTKYEEVNLVTYPAFSFDYPDNWTVTSEKVSPTSEEVILTNDTGVTITYWYFGEMRDLTGPTSDMKTVDVMTMADASFTPGYVQATDYSDLGEFMVAKLTTTAEFDMHNGGEEIEVENGNIRYALLPESEAGERLEVIKIGLPTFSFWYAGHISMIANTPNDKFTEQEEKEVIAILASFREGSDSEQDTKASTQNTDTNTAESLDELWEKLDGVWEFEEYIYNGESAPYNVGTVEFQVVDKMPCMVSKSLAGDVSMHNQIFYDLASISESQYDAYTYKRGYFGGEDSNWSDDVRLVWYSFDLSNISEGELLLGYHIGLDNGFIDDHAFKYKKR